MENPLVSIIIPLYNSSNHIIETVESALNQTWKNTEIIIVDDGSTDNSLAIAKTLSSTNVKIFSQDNKGASAARNLGLKNAKGDYIQYLDADDLLSAEKIEKQILALKDKPEQIAMCPTIYFLDGENPFKNQTTARKTAFMYSTSDNFNFLLNLYGVNGNGSMVTIHSWLTPKKIIDEIGPWNEELSVDDDGEYFCRVILKASGIVYTPDIYNYYRKYKNGNNLANQSNIDAIESIFNALILKENHLLSVKKDETIKYTFAQAYFKLAVGCYPKYKILSKKIMDKANLNSEIKTKLFIGSKSADFIANNFSWKLVKYIQYLKENFKRK